MKIKLRGIVKVAKEHGLYLRAVKLNERTYVTGQGVVPGKPETAKFLTFDEMTGKKMMSEEKLKMFPVVIDPLKQYHFKEGHTFDTETPEGKAFYDFVKLCSSGTVADSHSEIIRGEHKFYFENKIRESKQKFDKYSKSIEAGIKLQKLTQSELMELAIYLHVNYGETRCNKNQPIDIRNSCLFEYAHEKPAIVLKALKKENLLDIKVASIVSKGIITRRNGEFYEGNMFIAGSFDHLVEIYRTDATKASRWDNKIKTLSNDVHATFDSPTINVAALKADLLEAVVENDSEKYSVIAKLIKKSGNSELYGLLSKYKLEETKSKELTTTELLRMVNSGMNWFKFFEKFISKFPDSALTKKDEIIEFLKGN